MPCRSDDSVVVSALLPPCGSWVSNVEGSVLNDSTCGAILPILSQSFSLNSWVMVSPSLTDSQSRGFWAVLLIWLQRSVACITNCQEGKNQALVALRFSDSKWQSYLPAVCHWNPALLCEMAQALMTRVCKNMFVHKVVMLAAAIPSSYSVTEETTADRLPEWLPEAHSHSVACGNNQLGCIRAVGDRMAARSSPKGKRMLCTVRVWALSCYPLDVDSKCRVVFVTEIDPIPGRFPSDHLLLKALPWLCIYIHTYTVSYPSSSCSPDLLKPLSFP